MAGKPAVPWEGKPGDAVFLSADHGLPTGGEGQQQLSSLAPVVLEQSLDILNF